MESWDDSQLNVPHETKKQKNKQTELKQKLSIAQKIPTNWRHVSTVIYFAKNIEINRTF